MFLHTQTKKWSEGPEMNFPRYFHGCTTIPSTEVRNAQIIVVGGIDSQTRIIENTVEILDVSSNSWLNVEITPLIRLYGNTLTASNSPEYKLYSIGGQAPTGNTRAIYGLTQSNTWVNVGNLTEGRSFHTSLNVDKNDILGCA